MPVQHSQTCQFNTHRRASSTLTCCWSAVTRTTTVLLTRRASSTLTDVPDQHSQTCQINTHRRASSTLTCVPVQHSHVCQFNTHLLLVCDSYNHRADDKTCQFNTHRPDVPVQHSRHSTHRQLGRPRRRQRLELVELILHPTPLNQLRTSLAPLNDAHYIMNQTIFMLSLHVCSFFRITVRLSVAICISTKN